MQAQGRTRTPSLSPPFSSFKKRRIEATRAPDNTRALRFEGRGSRLHKDNTHSVCMRIALSFLALAWYYGFRSLLELRPTHLSIILFSTHSIPPSETGLCTEPPRQAGSWLLFPVPVCLGCSLSCPWRWRWSLMLMMKRDCLIPWPWQRCGTSTNLSIQGEQDSSCRRSCESHF